MCTTANISPSATYSQIVGNWLTSHPPQKISPARSFSGRKYYYTSDEKGSFTSRVERKVMSYRLLSYLEFLIWAEQGPVTDVCIAISNSKYQLSTDLIEAANSVKEQEYNHSHWAYELLASVENSAKVRALWILPQCGRELDSLTAQYPQHQFLAKLFLVAFAEIADFNTASQLIGTPQIAAPVREFAVKHETEERLHRVYFRTLFADLWPQFNEPERRFAATAIPRVLYSFVVPNFEQDSTTTKIISESTHSEKEAITSYLPKVPTTEREVWKRVDEVCQDTMKHLDKVGVFSDPSLRVEFFKPFQDAI